MIYPWVDKRPSSAVDFLENDRHLHACKAHISRAAVPGSRVHTWAYTERRENYRARRPVVADPATGGRRTAGEPAISETEKRRHDRLICERLIYSFTVAQVSSRSHTVVHRVGQVMRRIADARSFHRAKSFAFADTIVGLLRLKWVNSGCLAYTLWDNRCHMIIIFLRFKRSIHAGIKEQYIITD